MHAFSFRIHGHMYNACVMYEGVSRSPSVHPLINDERRYTRRRRGPSVHLRMSDQSYVYEYYNISALSPVAGWKEIVYFLHICILQGRRSNPYFPGF